MGQEAETLTNRDMIQISIINKVTQEMKTKVKIHMHKCNDKIRTLRWVAMVILNILAIPIIKTLCKCNKWWCINKWWCRHLTCGDRCPVFHHLTSQGLLSRPLRILISTNQKKMKKIVFQQFNKEWLQLNNKNFSKRSRILLNKWI